MVISGRFADRARLVYGAGKGSMAYRIVKGRFHLCYRNAKGAVRGSKPDGDSIWFEPFDTPGVGW